MLIYVDISRESLHELLTAAHACMAEAVLAVEVMNMLWVLPLIALLLLCGRSGNSWRVVCKIKENVSVIAECPWT